MGTLARRWRIALSVLSLAVFTSIVAQTASAATVEVGSCKIGLVQFGTISAAITAVPLNSTIYICPGTYPEQLLITKNLSLIGLSSVGLSGGAASGANNPVIIAPTNGVVVNASDLYNGFPIAAQIAVLTPPQSVTSIKVNISNIAVDGSNNLLQGCGTDLEGIYYQNASGTINQVVTRNQELEPAYFGCQDGLAIYVESGYGSGGTATVTIENSSVHDYDKNGITAKGSGTVATITGNYVVGIGATTQIAQNGIEVSFGASGSVKNNTVTDDVYINSENCSTCYGSSGILLYDSGGTAGAPIAISGNTVSNTQLAIVAYSDGVITADYNNVTLNKITGTLAAGPYLDDGIDLCSNYNMAVSNVVYNSAGAGVHIDSTCTESNVPTGNYTTVTKNTVNEACAGVLSGTGSGNTIGTGTLANLTYNVVQVVQPTDACPVGVPGEKKTRPARHRPQPMRH